jgi:hypothetical protein
MNRARLWLVLLVLGATAATAPAQYDYPGYPGYGPQPPFNGAFPAYGMPINPVPIVPNTMVSTGAFRATPPPAANGFSTPPSQIDPVVDPPYIPRIWGSFDYMLWIVKSAPKPVPIVTKGSDADLVPGAVGQMGTMVLEGNSNTSLGDLAGGRVSVGMWLNYDRSVGIEGSAFATENAIKRFSIGSDSTGNPPLFVPFFNNALQAEDALTLADPLAGATGRATVTSTFEFRGAELNGILSLCRSECLEVDLLAGARYLRLAESLNVGTESTSTPLDTTTSTFDGFGTRNEFYGGQLGGRVSLRSDRLSWDTTAKVAVGPTYQTLDVTGSTNAVQASTGIPLGTTSGGAFTAASNIRHQTHNQISAVPQIQTKFGLDVSSNLTVFAAYDFLYWTEVIRPGDQMDHALSPAPLFRRSDFWAQGVTFGMEIKF